MAPAVSNMSFSFLAHIRDSSQLLMTLTGVTNHVTITITSKALNVSYAQYDGNIYSRIN